MEKLNLQGIRHSCIAGSWYPGTEGELRRMLDGFFRRAEKEELGGELVGLIAPHAGYMYSGQVAAYAYRQLEGLKPDTVVVLGPSHQMYISGYAVTAVRHYETPLGLVELDGDFIAALHQKIGLTFLRRDVEHSLEIQLPFLQYVLGAFKLVPVMLGEHSLSYCRPLAEALGEVMEGRNAVLVASSDLSHYHGYDTAVRLDSLVLKRVNAFDAEGLAEDLERGKAEACGGGPIITAMLAARKLGANKAKVLKYANSGDVTGDRWRVVGYMAGAIYREASG